MANEICRIDWGNMARSSTATSTSAVTGFPVTNINTNDPQRMFRMTYSAGNMYVTLSNTTQYQLYGVYALNTNMGAPIVGQDLITLQTSTDNFATSTNHSVFSKYIERTRINSSGQSETYYYGINFAVLNAVNAKQFRFQLNFASGQLAYYEIGEIVAFYNAYTPTSQFNSGFTFGREIIEGSVENQFGDKFVYSRVEKYSGEIDFQCDDTQATTLEKIFMQDRVMFWPSGTLGSPGTADFFYGKMEQIGLRQNLTQYGNSPISGLMDKRLSCRFNEAL